MSHCFSIWSFGDRWIGNPFLGCLLPFTQISAQKPLVIFWIARKVVERFPLFFFPRPDGPSCVFFSPIFTSATTKIYALRSFLLRRLISFSSFFFFFADPQRATNVLFRGLFAWWTTTPFFPPLLLRVVVEISFFSLPSRAARPPLPLMSSSLSPLGRQHRTLSSTPMSVLVLFPFFIVCRCRQFFGELFLAHDGQSVFLEDPVSQLLFFDSRSAAQ